MKSHTSEFKEEIKTLGKQQSVRITYKENNVTKTLTDEDINSATPNYEASLLKSVMKVLELDSNVNIPKGTEIKFEYGLLVNGAYEYLNYGNYIVAKEPEKQEDTLSYKITCYDKMLYSMKDYEHIDIPYPCTIKQYLVALCNKIGLQFKDSDFANANRQITSELFMTINEDGTYSSMGYTYRDVLDQIAETTGGCICITLDDKVEVRYINKALEYSTSKNTNKVEIETQVKEKVKTINIDGNSYQETTEGYNLLNVPANFTVTNTDIHNDIAISLKANITYTIKAKTISSDNKDVKNCLFRFRYNNADVSNPNARIPISGLKTTYTPPADIDEVWIYSGTGHNESALSNTTFEDLMIYEGTEDKPYEPYTGGAPSPSPDYPQEITNVGGYDNLFDKNNIISGSYVSDSNGAFVSNSTSKRTAYIEIQANSYYHIYSDKTSENWGAWYDKDKKFISGITLGGKKEGIVNSPANAKYMAFTISYQGNLTDYSKIKINETAIKIKHSGKNKVDFINYAEKVFDSSKVEKLSDGSYKFKHCDTVYTLFEGLLKAPCTLSWYARNDGTTTTSATTFNFKIFYEDGTAETLSYTTSPDFSLKTKVLTKNIIKIVNTYIRTAPLTIIKDVQLEKGSKATSYEPYHEPIITPINLQGNVLSKVGDVKDILRVNRNGEVKIEKNIWEETIKFSILITLPNNNKGIAFTPSKKKITSMSDNDYLVTNAQRNRTFNDGTVYQNPLNFVFVGSPTDTLETIKAKFNGGKILYQLATPQTITLPSISPIELWQGTNIFSLVTNLDTEIELEYPTNYDTIDEEYINDTNVNFGEKYRAY